MGPKSKAAKTDSHSSGTSSRSYQKNLPAVLSGEDDELYRLKRDRNNIAVKKSREKSRLRARETTEKMARLRQENEELERRTAELACELRTLKDILLTRAGRRNRTNNDASSGSASSHPSKPSKFILADPQTVSIDHKYSSHRSAGGSSVVSEVGQNDLISIDEELSNTDYFHS